MSLLFENACDSFDVENAHRCEPAEDRLTPADVDPVPVCLIAARAAHRNSLTADGRVHLPLHSPTSPELTDEFVTYLDHDVRGELILLGPPARQEQVSLDEFVRTPLARQLRYWTSENVPDTYPEYYRSPVDIVEQASTTVDTGFLEELRQYVKSEMQAARSAAGHRRSADCADITHRSRASQDGTTHHRFELESAVLDGATDPEGVIRDELGFYTDTELLIHDRTGDHDDFPLWARVSDVTGDTIWVVVDWGMTELAAHERVTARKYLQRGSLVVKPVLNRVPYERRLAAIQAVEDTGQWHEVLTGRRELTFEDTAATESTHFDDDLNQEQQLAVEHALRADDLFCIHGPPGTGKTRTLIEIIRQSADAGRSVLVCADSNQAADNVLIGDSSKDNPDPGSLHAYTQHGTGEFRTRRHNARRSGSALVQDRYARVDGRPAVVVSTNGSAAELDRSFDIVVIDEATQATCPSSCIPLQFGDKVVLAGDHKQLPPFSRTEEPPESAAGLSLFEHLYADAGLYEGVGVQLRRQYRMESTLAHFPNREFYDMTLEAGRDIDAVGEYPPIDGFDVGGSTETRGTSYCNVTEARVVARLAARLVSATELDPAELGVITPYSAQVGEIESRLQNGHEEVTVDTVDAFQGGERTAILISFVRSNATGEAGFLTRPRDGPRRLNVSMTRAKQYCGLVGDWDTLTTDPADTDTTSALYDSLKTFLEETGRMRSLDPDLV